MYKASSWPLLLPKEATLYTIEASIVILPTTTPGNNLDDASSEIAFQEAVSRD